MNAKKSHIKSWAFYWKGAVGLLGFNQPIYAYIVKTRLISERFVKDVHICFILKYCEKKLYDIEHIDIQYDFLCLLLFLLTLLIALERLRYISVIFFLMWYDLQWNNFWIVFSRYKTASVSPMVVREDPSSQMIQGKENGEKSRYRFTQILSCS